MCLDLLLNVFRVKNKRPIFAVSNNQLHVFFSFFVVVYPIASFGQQSWAVCKRLEVHERTARDRLSLRRMK